MFVTQLITFENGLLDTAKSIVFKNETVARSTARCICGPGYRESVDGDMTKFERAGIMVLLFRSRLKFGMKR